MFGEKERKYGRKNLWKKLGRVHGGIRVVDKMRRRKRKEGNGTKWRVRGKHGKMAMKKL